jgi:hypothetical protein
MSWLVFQVALLLCDMSEVLARSAFWIRNGYWP